MRRIVLAAVLVTLFGAPAMAQMSARQDLWPQLVVDVFEGRAMQDGAGVIALDAPYRAEDAAIVPITIRSELPAGSHLRIENITLVIDNNPAPVAAHSGPLAVRATSHSRTSFASPVGRAWATGRPSRAARAGLTNCTAPKNRRKRRCIRGDTPGTTRPATGMRVTSDMFTPARPARMSPGTRAACAPCGRSRG